MIELQRETAYVPTMVLHEAYKFMFQNLEEKWLNSESTPVMTAGFKIVPLTSATLRCQYDTLPTADSIIAATSV